MSTNENTRRVRNQELTQKAFHRIVETRPHLTSIDQWRQLADIPRGTFYNALYGKTTVNVVAALKIARAGGCLVEDLFGHLADNEDPQTEEKGETALD